MERERNYEYEYEKQRAKDPIYRSIGLTGSLYAIFRVGERKYKTIAQIRHYQNHMERLVDTPNADLNIKNEILIGSSNIVKDVQDYIKDVKLRSNSVIARDLLLTASPAFFKNIPDLERRKWVELNLQWLKDNFGDNCVYATLHKDETTWHISALIVPKFYDEKKKTYILSNTRYFDGIAKLSKWQDDYSSGIQKVFKSLNRGIKFSKAKHIEIRHYYAMLNSKLKEEDITQVCAKAKNSELMEMQVKNLRGTLNAYRDYSKKTEIEKESLVKNNEAILNNLENLRKDKEIYKETLKALSEIYKIPQSAVVKVIDYVESQLNKDQQIIKGKELNLNKKENAD